jgi:hypothetical protein
MRTRWDELSRTSTRTTTSTITRGVVYPTRPSWALGSRLRRSDETYGTHGTHGPLAHRSHKSHKSHSFLTPGLPERPKRPHSAKRRYILLHPLFAVDPGSLRVKLYFHEPRRRRRGGLPLLWSYLHYVCGHLGWRVCDDRRLSGVLSSD